VICYAGRLQWGPARVRYAATLVADAHAPREQATTRGVELPQVADDVATWRHAGLGIAGRWCRGAPAIAQCLADGPEGAIDWTCHIPRARAQVRVGDTTLDGWGYVESVRLTIPPWRLPFGTLRWGRYLSDRHWLVWIDWSGGTAGRRCWTWLDGAPQPEAVVHAAGVRGLRGGSRLEFGATRVLRDRPLLDTLRTPLPALARRLAPTLSQAHECKRLGAAALVTAAGASDQGCVLYEDVSW